MYSRTDHFVGTLFVLMYTFLPLVSLST